MFNARKDEIQSAKCLNLRPETKYRLVGLASNAFA